jgi:hypothetical protein
VDAADGTWSRCGSKWGAETPAKGATIGLNGNRERHLVAVRSGGPPCHSTSMPSMTRSMTPYSSAWVLGMER